MLLALKRFNLFKRYSSSSSSFLSSIKKNKSNKNRRLLNDKTSNSGLTNRLTKEIDEINRKQLDYDKFNNANEQDWSNFMQQKQRYEDEIKKSII